MSQIANVTVFDGAAVPVSHTLVAIDVTREKDKVTANWRENLPTLPVYAQVRMQMTMQKLKSGVYKTETRVVVPVMETVQNQNAAGYTAQPKVAYENTHVQTGFFHERSDSVGRRLAYQIGLNVGNNISTSVTPAAAGPFYDLFAVLSAPT